MECGFAEGMSIFVLAIHQRCRLISQDAWRNRVEHTTASSMLMPCVLIMEDDDDGRRAIARLFARADWKVCEAADGDAGVELALRNRPAVISRDFLMPNANRFQVCRT